MSTTQKWLVGIVVALVIGFLGGKYLGSSVTSVVAGAINNGAQVQNYPFWFTTGVSGTNKVLYAGSSQQWSVADNGAVSNTGTSQLGSNGTATSRVNFGSCIAYAYATTIAASTTAEVDCQAGTNALTALTGVSSGDNVFVNATSSIPATFEGLEIRAATASTTNGFIDLRIYNGTGATFTWTNTASSSFQYFVIH